MSLANLIIQPTRAVIQADAGAYLPDGTLAALHPKIRTFPAARAAMSWTGGVLNDAMNAALYTYGLALTSLGDLCTNLPDALRRATALTAHEQYSTASCLRLIAWDPGRRAPIGMILTNDAAWFDGAVQPYSWVVVDNSMQSTDALSDIGLDDVSALSDPLRFDIERDSVRLIEAQRRRPWGAWPKPDPTFQVAVRIGGWVDQVEVTREGLKERRILHWPGDSIGTRIKL